MIRHIVLFTAKKADDKQRIYEGLCLLKAIPQCLHLEISINRRHDEISHLSPDVIVYGEFESDEQLQRFKAHDLYQQSIQLVRPLRDIRIAADFNAEKNTTQSI